MDLRPVATHDPVEVTDEERDAAVVVPILEPDGGPRLLFTLRAEHLGEHPGQMSFPGGGREPVDEDHAATAFREAREEIGALDSEIDIVGRLDDIRTVSNYAVTPFVARLSDREYEPNEAEVADIAKLPLDALADPQNYKLDLREYAGRGERPVHYFDVGGVTVWGATGRILAQFLELTTDWKPAVQDVTGQQFVEDGLHTGDFLDGDQ